VKDKIKQKGKEGRRHLIAKFEYFEVIDIFFSNRPVTQPKVVIDSLADRRTSSNADNEASDIDNSVPPAKGTTTGSGNSTNSISFDSSDEPTVHVKQKSKRERRYQATNRCETGYIK